MDKGKAIDRIQKLLKRTEDNGATKSEAEAAAAEAAWLLAKFNLSIAEVERAACDMVEGVTEFTRSDRVAVQVATIVQEFYFVRILYRGPLIILFGEAHNVEVARYIFQFLHGEFSRLCADEFGRLQDIWGPLAANVLDNKLEPFCSGLVIGLGRRLWKERDLFAPGERNALVAIDTDIDKALSERFPDRTQVDESPTIDPRDPTFRRGVQRGEQIQIREGIAGQAGGRPTISEGGRT
ncbi:DUF2786 domain-containing protein [Bremerella sp. JC770]|uniref:DUF7168 domain-containing protein n=1 Tax=Bremerella sp. JC770 TaxID=3232137 RepID=UPI00345925BD